MRHRWLLIPLFLIILPGVVGCEAFLKGYTSPEADLVEQEIADLKKEYDDTVALIDKYKKDGVTGIPLAEATKQLADITSQIKDKAELAVALIEKAKSEAGPGLLDILGFLAGVFLGGGGGVFMEKRKNRLLNTPPPMIPSNPV